MTKRNEQKMLRTRRKCKEEFAADEDSLIPCELCGVLVRDDCPEHPLVIVENAIPLQQSLVGEPACVSLYRSRVTPSKVGAFASSPLSRNVRFGPSEGELEGSVGSVSLDVSRQSSMWMRQIQRSANEEDCSLVAFRYKGALFVKTCKEVADGEELVLKAEVGDVDNKLALVCVEETSTTITSNCKGRGEARDSTSSPKQCLRGIGSDPGHETSHRIHHFGMSPEDQTMGAESEKQCNKCDICFKTFSKNYALKNHMLIHTGEKPYGCDFCNKAFSDRSTLRSHRMIHTGERPYQCEFCAKNFTHRITLQSHRRIHTGERPYKCDICSKAFTQKSGLRAHLRIHSRSRPYKCDICLKTFTEKGAIRCHMRIHTGEKPFKCDICSKTFSQSSNFRCHMQVHTTDKPYKCDLCSKTFGYSTSLRNHFSTHSDEKPFICDICSRGFSLKKNLRIHMVIHSGEKNFKCDICCKTFTQRIALKNHMLIHTGEKAFKCDICCKTFSLKGNLKRHMRIHSCDRHL